MSLLNARKVGPPVHTVDTATLRVGVLPTSANAPRHLRAAIEDAAALLSMHGHRVIDLSDGTVLTRLIGRLLGHDRQPNRLTAYDVLLGAARRGQDRDHPEFAGVVLHGSVEIRLAGKAGMSAQVHELVRLILLDQGTPARTTPTYSDALTA